MRCLYTSVLTLLLALLALSAGTVRADGLLYQLPKDGGWVRFDEEVTGERNGMKFTGNGSLTMSSVGQTTEKGEKCRWIEVKRQMNWNPFGRSTFIFKLLIPEKYLKKDEKPLEHIVRGWSKRQKGEPQELRLPLEGPAYLHALLPGPLKDVKKLEKKVIDGKLGKLECRGLTGATEFKRGDDDVSVIYETRLHEKAPFGVVSCSKEVEFERDGQERESLTGTLKLTDFGKTALTELPNHN